MKSTEDLARDVETALFDAAVAGRPVGEAVAVPVAAITTRARELANHAELHRPELAEVAFAHLLVDVAHSLYTGSETHAGARARILAAVESEGADDASVIALVLRQGAGGHSGRVNAVLVDVVSSGELSGPHVRRSTGLGPTRLAVATALLRAALGGEPNAMLDACSVCGREDGTHAPGCMAGYLASKKGG